VHICYLTHEYPPAKPGGIGVFVQTLARRLKKRGHRITVVGVWDRHHDRIENDQGVEIHRVALSRWPTCRFIPHNYRIGRVLRRINAASSIDIVEASNMGLAFLSRTIPGTKVVRLHGGHLYHCFEMKTPYGPWRSYQERTSLRKADHICSCGDYVGRITAGITGLSFDSFTVIHNLTSDRFEPMPEVGVIPRSVLFIGVVYEKKGIRQLVQALLKITGEFPDVTLTIAGRDKIDPRTGRSFREETLLPLIPEKELHRFDFKGPVEHRDLPELMARSALCVYPSHTEAMPVAWLETLAMGRPMIAADIGPGRELIDDGRNGLLCDPHSADDIARKMSDLLRDPARAEELGRAGRIDFEKRFSQEKLVDRNIAFYERCVSRSSARSR